VAAQTPRGATQSPAARAAVESWGQERAETPVESTMMSKASSSVASPNFSILE
jgi:hypothetical protein